MIVTNKSPVLTRQRIEVKAEGENVALVLGNVTARMDYETAIQVGLWLLHQGKKAKLNAGDKARHWTVIADLSAVENGERPW